MQIRFREGMASASGWSFKPGDVVDSTKVGISKAAVTRMLDKGIVEAVKRRKETADA